MPAKTTARKSIIPWIAAGAGVVLGWLLMHLLVTNWSSLKALYS